MTRTDKSHRILFLFFVLVFWLGLNFLTLHSQPAIFHVDNKLVSTHASIIASNAETPAELPGAGWQPVTLPDDWWVNKRQDHQHWYRFTLHDLSSTSDRLAVYLPTVTHNVAVYLNQQWIGQGGDFTHPITRNHNTALLFTIPPAQISESANTLYIRVAAESARQGLLGRVYIGDQSVLSSARNLKQFIRVDLIVFLTIAMYILSVVLGLIWFVRRQDTIYAVFAAELFLWATHNLNLFVLNIPTSAYFWEAMTMATLGWTVVMMVFYNHRYVNHRYPFAEPVLWVFCLAGFSFFIAPDINSILNIGYAIWDSCLILIGLYAMIHLLGNYWRKPNWDVFLLLLAGTPIIVFGFHDILLVNGFIDRSEGLIIQYSGIPVIVVFTWFLLRRFVRSINQAETLSTELQQRVEQREAELTVQYQKLATLEQQQLLINERERIMRDMHDGIGGNLVRTLSLLERETDNTDAAREEIKQGITDLRLVVNSLDPMLGDIGTLLGAMRQRMTEQLEAANIQLQWQVGDLPDNGNLSPQQSLHLLRILQEAITNTIKHASASLVILSAETANDNTGVAVSLKDNGTGFDINAQKEQMKRGLRNMQYRAGEAGIDLVIDSGDQGTSVTATLKL